MLHDLSRRWAVWRLRRRTIAQLRVLDRHMLADIGIPRGRIEACAEAEACHALERAR